MSQQRIFNQLEHILQTCKDENREITPSEQETFSNLENELKKYMPLPTMAEIESLISEVNKTYPVIPFLKIGKIPDFTIRVLAAKNCVIQNVAENIWEALQLELIHSFNFSKSDQGREFWEVINKIYS